MHCTFRIVPRIALACLTAVAGFVIPASSASATAQRPTVTNVTPRSGPPTLGNHVWVSGIGFTASSVVTFGSIRAAHRTVVSSTRINVLAPPHRLGSSYVHVTTAGGTSPAAWGNRYTFTDPPASLTNGVAQTASTGTITSISCPSANFCAVAADDGSVNTYNGSTWATPLSVDPAGHLASVSCPTATFCVAVDDRGYATAYHGVGWSTPTLIDTHALTSVSCPAAGFCMAVDARGYVVAFSKSTWHTPRHLVSSGGLSSVSCASSTFCYAVGLGGYAVRYTGSWETAHKVEAFGLTSVSCSSSTSCLAGRYTNSVRFWTGGPFGPRIRPLTYYDEDDPAGYRPVADLSCVTVRFCNVVFDFADASSTTSPDALLDGAAATSQPVAPLALVSTTSCWAVNECMNAGGAQAAPLG